MREPATEHEREIVRKINAKAAVIQQQKESLGDIVQDMAFSVGFVVTSEEMEFAKSYAEWLAAGNVRITDSSGTPQRS